MDERQRRTWWVLDLAGRPGAAAADEIRAVLRALAPHVETWECDVPLDVTDAEPPDVRAAAATLAAVDPLRMERGGRYTSTGLVQEAAGPLWEAFVTLAPHVYDASAWCHHSGRPFVSLGDEGAGVALWLDHEELALVSSVLDEDRLVQLPRRRRRWWRR